MFWKCKCTKIICIILSDDFEEQHKQSRAISKYLEERHLDDLRKGRIVHGTLYTHPMVTEEIQLYGNCELDIIELHDYISKYAKSTTPIMKGE